MRPEFSIFTHTIYAPLKSTSIFLLPAHHSQAHSTLLPHHRSELISLESRTLALLLYLILFCLSRKTIQFVQTGTLGI